MRVQTGNDTGNGQETKWLRCVCKAWVRLVSGLFKRLLRQCITSAQTSACHWVAGIPGWRRLRSRSVGWCQWQEWDWGGVRDMLRLRWGVCSFFLNQGENRAETQGISTMHLCCPGKSVFVAGTWCVPPLRMERWRPISYWLWKALWSIGVINLIDKTLSKAVTVHSNCVMRLGVLCSFFSLSKLFLEEVAHMSLPLTRLKCPTFCNFFKK